MARKPISHVNVKQFIKADQNTGNLVIYFDHLCKYLFEHETRNFSVSQFEKILNRELIKLRGYVVDEKLMTRVCEYIDELSAYLTNEKALAQRKNDISLMTKRFQEEHPADYQAAKTKMLADMRLAKTQNPKLYKAMLARYKKRFGENA